MTAPGAGGREDGGAWRWVALALPVAVIGLVLVAALAVFGLGRSPTGDPTGDAAPPPADLEPGIVEGPAAVVDGVATVDAGRHDGRPPPVLSGVGVGDLLDVRGRGFAGDAEGVIAQCDAVGGRRCRNLFPVRTDEDGDVRVLYRLAATPPGTVLVVDVDDDRGVAVVKPPAPVAPVAPVGDAAAPADVDLDGRRVDLDGRRVATGLIVALVLLGVAAQLIRSTDWRVPAEAEVPTFLEPS